MHMKVDIIEEPGVGGAGFAMSTRKFQNTYSFSFNDTLQTVMEDVVSIFGTAGKEQEQRDKEEVVNKK